MNNGLIVQSVIEINANASKVWNALTSPQLIKKYLFGTEAVSEWKVGSHILFKGIWEGKNYEDKGLILKSEENKIFQYAYWTSFSGLEDKLENYANITYELIEKGQYTLLSITQDSIETEDMVSSLSQNWDAILKGIKEIVEEKRS